MRALAVLALFLISLCHGDTSQLNVHIIPHSHCDPGWLNTYDKYYADRVSKILNAVTTSLDSHPNRTFVWSESSFFSRWFDSATPSSRDTFKRLVSEGRIEFIGGGWVQNDEASPTVYAIINQMFVGHQYLLKHFGVAPTIGWQIDPFGHSLVTPTLYSLFGFDAVVVNRIHYAIKDSLKSLTDMEFIWKGSPSTEIFTHVLHTHYSAPKGFDWEESGSPSLLNSDKVAGRANKFAADMKNRAKAYKTNHLLVPFGDDFKFVKAEKQFSNMDVLMQYFKMNPDLGINLHYSTPSTYFNAVSKSDGANSGFSEFDQDFFPYADGKDAYWTGYFTTRPVLKAMSRTVHSYLRASSIFHALARGRQDKGSMISTAGKMVTARENAALFLHHDAITGTARKNVVEDYMGRLEASAAVSLDSLGQSISSLLRDKPTLLPLDQAILTGASKVVIANPTTIERTEIVCMKVASSIAGVAETPSQIDFMVNRPEFSDPNVETSSADILLCWFSTVPSFGFTEYHVFEGELPKAVPPAVVPEITVFGKNSHPKATSFSDSVEISISNSLFTTSFSPLTGILRDISKPQKKISFTPTFLQYSTKKSGAYIFTPNSKALPHPSAPVLIRRLVGSVFSKAVVFSTDGELISTFKLFGGDSHLHAELSVVAKKNYELCAQLKTDLDSPILSTNNGLAFVPRQVRGSSRPETSFYPSVEGWRLENDETVFDVWQDHSCGVSHSGNGTVEMMIHRSLGQDDGRGLAEAVVDESRAVINIAIALESNTENLATSNLIAFAEESPVKAIDLETVSTGSSQSFWRLDDPHVKVMALRELEAALSDFQLILWNQANVPVEVEVSQAIDWKSLGLYVRVAYESSLSGNMGKEEIKQTKAHFKRSGSHINLAVVDRNASAGEGQNSDVPGVFISDIAREMEGSGERKLLSIGELSVTLAPQSLSSFILILGKLEPEKPVEGETLPPVQAEPDVAVDDSGSIENPVDSWNPELDEYSTVATELDSTASSKLPLLYVTVFLGMFWAVVRSRRQREEDPSRVLKSVKSA